MSAPVKTKEELTRLAWLTELRRQGDRQCSGMLFGGQGRVCALGLLAETAGLSAGSMNLHSNGAIVGLAGLAGWRAQDIIQMNDLYGMTFAEIADVVEKWFAP